MPTLRYFVGERLNGVRCRVIGGDATQYRGAGLRRAVFGVMLKAAVRVRKDRDAGVGPVAVVDEDLVCEVYCRGDSDVFVGAVKTLLWERNFDLDVTCESVEKLDATHLEHVNPSMYVARPESRENFRKFESLSATSEEYYLRGVTQGALGSFVVRPVDASPDGAVVADILKSVAAIVDRTSEREWEPTQDAIALAACGLLRITTGTRCVIRSRAHDGQLDVQCSSFPYRGTIDLTVIVLDDTSCIQLESRRVASELKAASALELRKSTRQVVGQIEACMAMSHHRNGYGCLTSIFNTKFIKLEREPSGKCLVRESGLHATDVSDAESISMLVRTFAGLIGLAVNDAEVTTYRPSLFGIAGQLRVAMAFLTCHDNFHPRRV